ncbi:hypothetical protein WT97_06680 [Burkholderia sp. MSMB1459WGS]|uniref:RebB family R body protein n=1 Tax=Burkholderia sp. MSMB1459WGS TaxID=1637970 RepID=UPI0007600631|nr:RebB family R body protein [Burkholderia sp. MSMB1459WGS]KWO47754.1 hypothetical protein WT97_06680 [Burkholderia sp. MSMB1459WGS]
MTNDDSTVNSQIVDAVSSIVTLTTGQSPSQAFGMLDAVLLETLGMAMHNAVNRQQSASMIGSAALTATCAKILGVPFPAPPAPPKPVPPLPPDVHPLPGPDEPVTPAAELKAAVRDGEAALGDARAAVDKLRTVATAAAQEAGRAEQTLDRFAQQLAVGLAKPDAQHPARSDDGTSADTGAGANTGNGTSGNGVVGGDADDQAAKS